MSVIQELSQALASGDLTRDTKELVIIMSDLKPGIPPNPEDIHPPSQKLSIVVVGLGMVGFSFLQKILDLDQEQNKYIITIIGEERYLAYNRVKLTDYFLHRNVDELLLSDKEFYEKHDSKKWGYFVDDAVVSINRKSKTVTTASDRIVKYDKLVLATGSDARAPGDVHDKIKAKNIGCYVYRTIDDLNQLIHYTEQNINDDKAHAIIVGGGLLALEAAKAVMDLGKFDSIKIVQLDGWLMGRQLDKRGGKLLEKKISKMGIKVECGLTTKSLIFNDDGHLSAVEYSNGTKERCDLICFAIGIVPRDDLARSCGLDVGPRGGVIVDNYMQTSDPDIYAIGECAAWKGRTYGLIAPGYAMADVLSFNLTQGEMHSLKAFAEPDTNTRLKLLGVDVAAFGDYFADTEGPKWLPKDCRKCGKGARALIYDNPIDEVYQKLIFTEDGRYLLGGILVGDNSKYPLLSALTKKRKPLTQEPGELIIGKQSGDDSGDGVDALPDEAQICSCNNISKGQIVQAIKNGSTTLDLIKKNTKAGTACGGCVPTLKLILESELKKMGKKVSTDLCVHFKYSRSDLFSIIMVKRYKTFGEVMENLGTTPDSSGCEICKPTIGSILSTLYGRHLMEKEFQGLQETNDRYLGNLQRNGTYSVVPRMSAGEITPEKLISIGKVAKKYDLYTKITGGQRVDLFGVKKQDLLKVWEDLHKAGFESGQAYGKTLRNVKSCVGSTWCRYGIGDSVGLAIRLEQRYRGIRSPHKIKGGVSGCVRDCAEYHSKDFGLCAVQGGFDIYVGGNGGMKPAAAQLLASKVKPDMVIRILDRYLMFYLRTADRLQRTARWLEKLDGGIDYLKSVIIQDKLGIAEELEKQMQDIVSHYFDEWGRTLKEKDSEAPLFKQFANTDENQESVEMVYERGQRRPALWADEPAKMRFNEIKWSSSHWKKVLKSSSLPHTDAGSSVDLLIGDTQLALFRNRQGKIFCSQNMCAHKRAFVLSRGISSQDDAGNDYISCPMHKRNYLLTNGACKNDPALSIATFDAKENKDDGYIYVKLPPTTELDEVLGTKKWMIYSKETEKKKRFNVIDQRYKMPIPVRGKRDCEW